ncbi:3-hydroxyacyl-CoA dehydrogenase type-2-like [Anthonomus grandis grandis]|uniref:3-hydroxyacyl-CoA dehydrogenase type-2-like n=1 Tax=Anthonomus grandis grandis TaxID=2921223 RepID=UPI002165AA41|nr:3-hydroxyacyl-CoA dehydrogenase type-2-like [Anthonomus grandis grandis]XP_050301514.1 3-hydroxyacyl-CoA dehydrogenase type-2-like [Anthonomus grandis grandis]
MLIKNSVFLVTGGASDQYGIAAVEALLKEGGKVIICDFPTKDLHIYGDDKAIFLPINIMDENDIKTLNEIIVEKYGRLDGVINCIDQQKFGLAYDFNKMEPQDLKEFTEVVHENVLGPFNVIRLTIPLMSKNIPKKGSGRGIIINMSNAAAFDGVKGSIAYAASKAAVIKMTESLSYELQGIQIRCVSIVTSSGGSDTLDEFDGIPEDSTKAANVISEPQKFADLIKTVIKNPAMNLPMMMLNNFNTS